MSLIEHTDVNSAKRAALFEDRRAALSPTECNRGERCYVRDGKPAWQRPARGNGNGYCAGCCGKLRAFERATKH